MYTFNILLKLFFIYSLYFYNIKYAIFLDILITAAKYSILLCLIKKVSQHQNDTLKENYESHISMINIIMVAKFISLIHIPLKHDLHVSIAAYGCLLLVYSATHIAGK